MLQCNPQQKVTLIINTIFRIQTPHNHLQVRLLGDPLRGLLPARLREGRVPLPVPQDEGVRGAQLHGGVRADGVAGGAVPDDGGAAGDGGVQDQSEVREFGKHGSLLANGCKKSE